MENIGVLLVPQIPIKVPVLYLIYNNENGVSALCIIIVHDRRLVDCPKVKKWTSFVSSQPLLKFDAICLSGIMLAILQPTGYDNFLDFLKAAHNRDVRIYFDTNFCSCL